MPAPAEQAVLKVIRYSLRQGVDEAAFVQASQALVAELANLEGFIRRLLLPVTTVPGGMWSAGAAGMPQIGLKSVSRSCPPV